MGLGAPLSTMGLSLSSSLTKIRRRDLWPSRLSECVTHPEDPPAHNPPVAAHGLFTDPSGQSTAFAWPKAVFKWDESAQGDPGLE